MSDSQARKLLVEEYAKAVSVRVQKTKEQLNELRALMRRFRAEDVALFRKLRSCEDRGEELGLYQFQITESIDVDDAISSLSSHLEDLEEDSKAVSDLRAEAEEADLDPDYDDDDDDEEEEEDDDEDDEELDEDE